MPTRQRAGPADPTLVGPPRSRSPEKRRKTMMEKSELRDHGAPASAPTRVLGVPEERTERKAQGEYLKKSWLKE